MENLQQASDITFYQHTANVSDEAFALRVKGDSMTSFTGGKSIPEGSVIIVDPNMQAEHGKVIVARLEDSNEATLKQLVIDGGAKYLKPFNNRLRSTSVATDGWPQVTVTAQMDVLVDGRPYALQSESSKWRADVALADAVAHLSGVRLLVIDRMDVLDLAGRSQFIGWMQAVQNDYDSVLIFGTLKTAPSLPAGMQSYWIEKGELES